jgi:hypothetical protein
MRAALRAGKSAIHGWGAFTKAPHAPGDLLVEYAGELVRRSVADARERAAYDTLVGAGTYVFGLGPDACVDATRAGAPQGGPRRQEPCNVSPETLQDLIYAEKGVGQHDMLAMHACAWQH